MTAASTVAYPLVRQLAEDWEHLYPSAVCAGIVGDQSHQMRGGYHIGRKFQSSRNYSVVRADDRIGPADAAAAIDMTLSRRDMILCTKRLMAVWSNPNDPRRKFLNAFNGWLGNGPAIRCDMVSGKRGTATADHKSHVHLEWRRRFVLTAVAVKAILSALAGETVAAYLKSVGVSAVAVVPGAKTATAAGPKPPAYPGRVLRRNDHQAKADPALKMWQARMIARGWKGIGAADGFFGARTETVVRRFQLLCRIDADGQIGPATWPRPWTQPLGS